MKTKTILIALIIIVIAGSIWYFTSGNSAKIECNTDNDCNNFSKCQQIACTCYKGKCETGYINKGEAEDYTNLQTSNDTFTALDESVELLE